MRVAADKVEYIGDSPMLPPTPRSGAMANADGIWGMRMNRGCSRSRGRLHQPVLHRWEYSCFSESAAVRCVLPHKGSGG